MYYHNGTTQSGLTGSVANDQLIWCQSLSWQNRTEGAYGVEEFAIDWEREQVRCPRGRLSASWEQYTDSGRAPHVLVRFRASDCRDCPVRSNCPRAAKQGHSLRFPLRELYKALRDMRLFLASEEGQQLSPL